MCLCKSKWRDFYHPYRACALRKENCNATHTTVTLKRNSVANSHLRTTNTVGLLIHVRSSLRRHKENFLHSTTISPYLTSGVFIFLLGTLNNFTVPYTNVVQDCNFKAHLPFGYLRDKTKDVWRHRSFCTLASRPSRGFILHACYLRVKTILHTSSADTTDDSMEHDSFMQVWKSTRTDFLEKDVTSSITFTEI